MAQRIRLAVLLMAVALAVPFALFRAPVGIPIAHAATRTWTGGGANSNWTNAANWGGTAPVAGDALVFPAGAARLANNNDYANGTAFSSITFQGGGYSISGNRVAITNILAAQHASGAVTLSLNLSGSGKVVVDGGGRLELAGDNSFAGEVAVAKGALRVKSSSALGSATQPTKVSAAAAPFGGLEIDGSFDVGETIDLDASLLPLIRAMGGESHFSGPIRAVHSGTAVQVDITASLTIDADILTGVIAKQGPGLLRVNGNTTDNLHVVSGPIEVNGNVAGGIGVPAGATLRGNGSVTGLLVEGGTVEPSGSPSTFSVNGPFGMDPSATFRAVIGAAGNGLLVSSTAPALGGAHLEVDLQAPGPIGSIYRIIRNDNPGPVSGTFAGLPQGAQFTAGGYSFRVSYVGGDGNDVTLTILAAATANLRVAATSAPEPALAGNTLTYSINVSNLGPASATDLVLSGQLGGGSGFVSLVAGLWTCSLSSVATTGQFSCSRDTLDNGSDDTITVIARIASGRTADIVATFSVSAATPDAVQSNNQSTVTSHLPGAGTPSPSPMLGNKRVLPLVAADG